MSDKLNAVQQIVDDKLIHDKRLLAELEAGHHIVESLYYRIGHTAGRMQALDAVKDLELPSTVRILKRHIADLEDALQNRHADDLVDELREQYGSN